MMTISLIPILGLICLVAVALAAISWRGASIARAIQGVEDDVALILQKDRENDQQLVSNLLAGRPIDDCFAQHNDARRKLVPTTTGAHWTMDDLKAWKKNRKQHEFETVNRRMLVPTFGVILAVITVCVVAVVILYEFQASSPETTDQVVTDSTPPSWPQDATDPPPLPLTTRPQPTADPSGLMDTSPVPIIQPLEEPSHSESMPTPPRDSDSPVEAVPKQASELAKETVPESTK